MQNSKTNILLTGATSSLCEAMIEELKEGSNIYLYLLMLSDDDAKRKISHELNSKKIEYEWDRVDCSNQKDLSAYIERKKIMFDDGVDIFIHFAGLTLNKPLLKINDGEWDEVFNVNMNSAFEITKACLPKMIQNKRGKFIFISSYQALTGGRGIAPYCASKSSLIGFSKSLAKENGKYGITSNVICPGYVDSKMTLQNPKQFKDQVIRENALKRINHPQSIGRFILSLLSQNDISGQVFNLDSRILP